MQTIGTYHIDGIKRREQAWTIRKILCYNHTEYDIDLEEDYGAH